MDEEIRQIQDMLRFISFFDEDIERTIPDGIYGESTALAVRSFQKKYGLYETGEVDNDTWDKIVVVYDESHRNNKREVKVSVVDEGDIPIFVGDASESLFVIQAMLLALSRHFENLNPVEITGVFDKKTQDAVEKVQIISGITPNAQIDRIFLNSLSELYMSYITLNNVENLL